MIESWKFLNGEKIMFPTSSLEAEVLGWHGVKHKLTNVGPDIEIIDTWLRENVQDRAFWFGPYYVYFYRETDATMFTLKWL